MEVPKFLIILLLATTVACSRAWLLGLPSLRQGSSLTVDEEGDFLVSPNGTFTSGFYKVGTDAYCHSIWYTNTVNKTVVWMANRDRPVGRRSKLTLQRNGDLVLTDAVGTIVWSTDTFSNAGMEAQLLETGNLVLINQSKIVVWQSFDFPTDTLLPTQRLDKQTILVSMRSQGTYLSGFYNFKFDDTNILYLVYNGPLISNVYWPRIDSTVFFSKRTPYNSSRVAILSLAGRFRSSDNLKFNAADYGVGPKRRLTIDYDGTLRLYSLDESTGLWKVSWLSRSVGACQVDGLCGENGICTYKPYPTCTCPYGFTRNNPSDWSKGCSPSFNLTPDSNNLDFMELTYTDYYGYDLNYSTGISFEACRNWCLISPRCKGFGYPLQGRGECFLKVVLLNGYHLPNSRMNMHIKVPKGFLSSNTIPRKAETYELNCSATQVVFKSKDPEAEKSNKNWYMKYLIGFVGSFAIIEIVCVGLTWWYLFRKHAHEDLANMAGYMALAMEFKHFTYSELKRATGNFKQEVGKGGFGTVYKGVLDDGRVVAVKRLEGILQGDAEFWAEVSLIGNVNHRNLVKLWGFCAENDHKLMVYEYLENGSLEKILFSDAELGLEKRYSIALGTAKGLSYLHEECLEWVLHCDVKPQNILLADNMEPRVADFGMSKLFKDIHGIKDVHGIGFSRVRVTRGYMAPEWMMNLKIDAKVDVYSYGVVLLELLSGRNASSFLSAAAQDTGYNHLVQWVIEKIRKEGLEKVIDPRLHHEFNTKLERLLKVALLCVQEDRNARPAMSEVVELLCANDEEKLDEDHRG